MSQKNKNAFSEEGVTSHEIIIDEAEGVTELNRSVAGENGGAKSDREDIEVKLKKLHSLYEQRLITSSEYESKRKELLEKF